MPSMKRCLFMKSLMFFFFLVVSILLGMAPIYAQDISAVVMSRGTSYSSQAFYAGPSFPERWIEQRQERGYAVSHISGSSSGWVVVASIGVPLHSLQIIESDSSFTELSKVFADWSKSGISVSGLVYSKGLWVAIGSSMIGYEQQAYLASPVFPEQEIIAKSREGFAITDLVYGDSKWVVMMTKGSPYINQEYIVRPEFPHNEVRDAEKQGASVTSIAHGNDLWGVVVTKNVGYGDQMIQVSEAFPENFIKEGWGKSYHITGIVMGNKFPQTPAHDNDRIQIMLSQQADLSSGIWFDDFINLSAPTEDAFVAVQRMAGYYIRQGSLKAAADTYRKYKPLFPDMAGRFDKIIALLEVQEPPQQIRNLGNGINTRSGEFQPLPTADGGQLYFTGMNRPGGVRGEDIFVSELEGNAWGRATGVQGKINTNDHEFGTAVSADGNRFMLFANRRQGPGRGDLFYSDLTREGWGELVPFKAPVNSPFWDCDGYLTSDGNAIIFASDRPGGTGWYRRKDLSSHGEGWGNSDLWVSLRTADGWSEPINLGTNVNTPFAERSPFLHPDGKTLYFSSSGHAGFGDLDIYKVTRLDENSWTKWSEPVNLGKQVNSVGADWGYKVSTAGDVAYYAANKLSGGFGGSDLYAISIPEELRPEPVATIRGIVTDPDGNPLVADIKWENLADGQNIGQLKTDPVKGNYFITVPLGKNYGYYAEKEGYYPVSNNVDLTNEKGFVNITENIVLVPVKKIAEEGVAVRINNIFFDVDEAELHLESRAELDRLAQLIKLYPNAKVEISGHTDSKASSEYNQRLSERRAQAVVDYLISVGGNRKLLVAKGYGETKPVAGNDTEEGRAMNRRVEFRFLKK